MPTGVEPAPPARRVPLRGRHPRPPRSALRAADALRARARAPARRRPSASRAPMGTVGFITPLSHTFCAECNRLRLTARGELRLCLFADRTYPLRPLLAAADPDAALEAEILRVLQEKPAEHMLTQGNYGNLHELHADRGVRCIQSRTISVAGPGGFRQPARRGAYPSCLRDGGDRPGGFPPGSRSRPQDGDPPPSAPAPSRAPAFQVHGRADRVSLLGTPACRRQLT